MVTSHIVTLAKEIEANTTKLDDYFEKNSLPRPSFDADAPLMYQLPPDIAAAQEALTAALDELYWLNQGPIQTVVAKSVSTRLNPSKARQNTDLVQFASSVGLRTILRYEIYNLVPLDSGATFQELADKTGVPVKKLTRLLRFGMTDHFFRESEPGYVKHTAASKALLQIPMLAPWSLMGMSEVSPAKMHVSFHTTTATARSNG